ncbi:MFS transporter [Roseobacter cerasinus]|uniref:MFS transporter n=1 Tax=Roseobacter cerasinus TaxID=2602289 RepID=A0A640VNJ3_9RHOB|nr:MFS transporter [Roseobacter cerasinus]GFE49813.1 MFS transporter [Roseobacter cerasinus]
MQTLSRLTGAAYGVHVSDQVALVSVPLIAALVLDASAAAIGLLVACQSMAHLVGSIPFGILVDSTQQRTLTIVACLTTLVGSAMAVIAILRESLVFFGAAMTLAGFGVVLFGLAALSIVPKIAARDGLARANAAIEVPRATASFIVPLLIGLSFTSVAPVVIFLGSAAASVMALAFAIALPTVDMQPAARTGVLKRIIEGGAFVLGHRLLLPISICAICWNLAFAALLVVLVPVIHQVYLMDPGVFGVGLSAFGLAAICGTTVMRHLSDRLAPNLLLLFGPGSSALASLGLVLIPAHSTPLVFYACMFLLGFGPSMWLVTQNSVRQLVTPADRLGRVNAVIQTAIYGIRPLGALLGGLVADTYGPQAGLGVVMVAFLMSFLAAALSDLREIRSYGTLSAAEDYAEDAAR